MKNIRNMPGIVTYNDMDQFQKLYIIKLISALELYFLTLLYYLTVIKLSVASSYL